MRKAVVSGPSTKHRVSHSAAAAATDDGTRKPIPAPGVFDPDPAKEVLERSRTGRTGYLVSPTGRAASPKPNAIASAHAPALRIDSPARSPQSSKLEADRAGRHGAAHTPTQGGAPERAVASGASGQTLPFVKNDVGHKDAIVVEARPRAPFLPETLAVHKEPEGVGSVEASRWQVLGLAVNGEECLREELREGGVDAQAIGPETFRFVPCPAGAPIILRVRNDSGHPACLSATLVGDVVKEAEPA